MGGDPGKHLENMFRQIIELRTLPDQAVFFETKRGDALEKFVPSVAKQQKAPAERTPWGCEHKR